MFSEKFIFLSTKVFRLRVYSFSSIKLLKAMQVCGLNASFYWLIIPAAQSLDNLSCPYKGTHKFQCLQLRLNFIWILLNICLE